MAPCAVFGRECRWIRRKAGVLSRATHGYGLKPLSVHFGLTHEPHLRLGMKSPACAMRPSVVANGTASNGGFAPFSELRGAQAPHGVCAWDTLSTMDSPVLRNSCAVSTAFHEGFSHLDA